MKISGTNVVDQPVEKVWDALLDPRVLVATIPGCERLVATGDNAYDMTVTAGVAAIKGTYQGQCTLSDLEEHRGLTMRLSGAGAPGTIDATVQVSFASPAAGSTEISYEADAVVGGMVGGVGQRMLSSVSKRMAGEFFGNVGSAIAGGPVVEPVETPAADAPAGTTFTAPAKASVSSQDDFLKGIAVGAGLVVLGVVVGRLFGRR
ncbi:carbon monoxide dehydrogenase [Nocardioides sp. Root1257]|uniref:SRPBCC family protein n=1 Tax=unclassified Nocardioides TaxID=2615069 RepID=UPI0006FF191D|nr:MULTISPECIES: carbon monoxide dehydrogenase subunit G [unclassified Nocardioides]KQW45131.1 carbon monoxide dehydrogenase [Nocardioides sp. Root1257]KRC45865.1 carbon monoxide dehydrogenase [Nocardioides sp. Root224]